MAISKQKKTDILAKLDEIKKESSSITFVHYEQIGGTDMTEMRSQLRDEGVGYFVAKKTLIKRSFKDSFEGDMPELDGEIAVAYSSDPIAPAQQVLTYVKKYKDSFSIVGGVFEGVYKNKEEMNEIATIPTLPVLRGMFVNVINSPIQGLVIALDAIAKKKEGG